MLAAIPSLRAFAISLTRNTDYADGLVQDAILRAWRNIWDWRLRLKQDLLVFEDGGETTLAACFRRGEHRLRDIELTGKRVRTNVAMVHEAGHPEPGSSPCRGRPRSTRPSTMAC